ncbi:MAG TPA: 50S ribosomal protein L29 [Lentisphaeria bacterium]|nr:MAG: 50S ribosomal protein L29 [Lentisphaerae bacterium GWF2_49_21]HBC85513.1 50S ribosomal protein L29 [Lentisphaeria bacterium]
MKAKEVKQMSKEELEHSLEEIFRERLNLRVQAKTGQLQNSARVSQIRRDIARIKTELRSRELDKAGKK